jgi:ABC-type sugar transport system ATPase subunit
VQQQLIAARDAGAAVLLISDDLDEVLTLGDRVAVMHGGHLGEARPAAAWTREAIGLAMAGQPRKARHDAARTTPRNLARRAGAGAHRRGRVHLVVSALLVLWAGAPVGRTYALLLQGGFGSVFAWSETLTRATR